MDCIKHLILPHAFNVRDMGGIVTKSGRAVRWNRLFRADALSALDAEEWQVLYQKGVRTVVDLRSLSETETFPDRVPSGIALCHCPMQEENLDIHNLDEGAAAAFRRSMSECYADMVRKTPHLLCTALHTVKTGLRDGAVIFHCTAGKDRTGVLAAVLLTILGAYDADILADYEVSNTYNRNGLHKILESMPNYEEMLPMLSSAPAHMEALLQYFRDNDLFAILAENGFSQADCAELRELVLCTA